MTAACTAYASLTVLGMAVVRQVVRGWSIEVPAVAAGAIAVSRTVVGDGLWVPLLVAAFAVPRLLIPRMPAPASDDTRQRVRRTTHAAVLLLAGLTAALFTTVAAELGMAAVDAFVRPH